MKSLKLILMTLAFPFLLKGCDKERFCGEYDLNGDGKLDKVFESFVNKKYSLYYFNGNNSDTNYVVTFSKRPFSWSFYDFKGDGHPDLVYEKIEKGNVKRFVINNNVGVFDKEAEEMKE